MFFNKSNIYTDARQVMVDKQVKSRGITNTNVIEAMQKVPRHLFVQEQFQTSSYEDRPLPIQSGQTISQPYIVALMTEQLKLNKESIVLEVGTGSGYQTAILAELAAHVYSIERIRGLAGRATDILSRLKYNNVNVFCADGSKGLQMYAPYDAIIVTCASEQIPENLVNQLKVGGRLCIPVGNQDNTQKLLTVTKDSNKHINVKHVTSVVFVPLITDD